jgi:sec-independent protein translocase protein TatA
MFTDLFRGWHPIIIILLVVLLFGAKRLPDAARSLGRSMRILKAETKGLRDDDVKAKAEAQTNRPAPVEGEVLSDDEPSPADTRDDRG